MIEKFLVILPFVSIIIFICSFSLQSSLEMIWLEYLGYFASGILLIICLYLEKNNFRNILKVNKWKLKIARFIIVILLFSISVVVTELSKRPLFNLTIDLSENRSNSLSQESIEVINILKKDNVEIYIDAFFTIPKIELKFRSLLGLYLKKEAPINIQYHDPYIDIIQAKKHKVDSENVIIISTSNKKIKLEIFDEESMTKSFYKLIDKKLRKIYFVKGHEELSIKDKSPDGISQTMDLLKEHYFESFEMNLSFVQSISKQDVSILVIAGPNKNYSNEEIKKISDYIFLGGSILLLVDALKPIENLNRFVNLFGITINSDFIVLNPEDPRVDLYGQNMSIINGSFSRHPIFRNFTDINETYFFLSDTRSVSKLPDHRFNQNIIFPLVANSDHIRIENVAKEQDLESVNNLKIEDDSSNVMAVLEGNHKNSNFKLAVFGSSQFISNRYLKFENNKELILNTMEYLVTNKNYVKIISKKNTADNQLHLSTSRSVMLLGAISFIYPFIFLVFGLIRSVIRNYK